MLQSRRLGSIADSRWPARGLIVALAIGLARAARRSQPAPGPTRAERVVPGQRHRGRRDRGRCGQRARAGGAARASRPGSTGCCAGWSRPRTHARLPRGREPADRRLRAELRDRRRGALEHPLHRASSRCAYDPDAVRDLLQRRRLAPSPSPSRCRSSCCRCTRTGQAARLWPDDNPWWQAWAEHIDPEQLLRLVLPLGDLEDMAMVSAAQAQARDPAALAALAARYGAEDTLVVTARTEGGAEPEQVSAVGLEAERIGRAQQMEGQPLSLAVGPDQPLERAAGEAVSGLQDEPRRALEERQPLALRSRPGSCWSTCRSPGSPIGSRSSSGSERLPEVSEIVMASFARDRVRASRFVISATSSASSRRWRGWAWRYRGKGNHGCCYRPGEIPAKASQPSATSTSF